MTYQYLYQSEDSPSLYQVVELPSKHPLDELPSIKRWVVIGEVVPVSNEPMPPMVDWRAKNKVASYLNGNEAYEHLMLVKPCENQVCAYHCASVNYSWDTATSTWVSNTEVPSYRPVGSVKENYRVGCETPIDKTCTDYDCPFHNASLYWAWEVTSESSGIPLTGKWVYDGPVEETHIDTLCKDIDCTEHFNAVNFYWSTDAAEWRLTPNFLIKK